MAEIAEISELEGEFESVTADIAKKEEISEAKPESVIDTLPEKYRGKNVADVVKMHQEAEKLASRHAQEVGEVRKLTEELLKSQFTKKAEVEKVQEVDFFENPQEAMRQAIKNSPEVQRANEYSINAQNQLALQSLAMKHPDYAEINNSSEFQEYVNKNRVRKEQYARAQNFDFDAADDLLGTFKELRAVKQQQITQVDTKARDSALNAASVETSGTYETSKKVYRSADLIKLRMREPARYDAMQDEIMRAYAEGRVK